MPKISYCQSRLALPNKRYNTTSTVTQSSRSISAYNHHHQQQQQQQVESNNPSTGYYSTSNQYSSSISQQSSLNNINNSSTRAAATNTSNNTSSFSILRKTFSPLVRRSHSSNTPHGYMSLINNTNIDLTFIKIIQMPNEMTLKKFMSY